MAQSGYVFKAHGVWYLRYRTDVVINGAIVRKQKAAPLAEVSDRFRYKSDLKDLVTEFLANVHQAEKCPVSSQSFVSYIEGIFLPHIQQNRKASTYSGYCCYWERYIRPRVQKYSLRDFTVAIVSRLLKDVAASYPVNRGTLTTIRSILSSAFSYAISEGHFPARSSQDNPAFRCRIPETAIRSTEPVAASREEVISLLAAFSDMPLERTAIAVVAMLGTRPGEARGLKWSDWNRNKDQIQIARSIWHTVESEPKTKRSMALVHVTPELREILLELWRVQGSPLDGFILAGSRGRPTNLDNMAKRSIRKRLGELNLTWPSWYALRRFHGTAVRAESNSDETAARALRNSKEVAAKHYIKPTEILPDVRKAVNSAVSGLTRVQ